MRFAKQIISFFLGLAFLISTSSISAQHSMHSMVMSTSNDKPIGLFNNIGNLHHPISTKNIEAQQYFDQGLALYYAFNRADALRSFRRASELDTNLAMAYWGMALSTTSSSYGYDCIQKALSLPASAKDRAYLEALSKTLPRDSLVDYLRLKIVYRNAMKKLYERYPDDPDAGVLYASSIVEPGGPYLERWNNNHDYTPNGAASAKVLAALVKKFPQHIGANHFYIHIVEGSRHPEIALPSAKMIAEIKFDNIRMGHLIHMPSHIYLLTGNYEAAAWSDEQVLSMVDTTLGRDLEWFIYGHSRLFLFHTYNMQGRYQDFCNLFANRFNPPLTANELQHTIFDAEALVRFRKWDHILNAVQPSKNEYQKIWAKGMAYAATGELEKADISLKEFLTSIDSKLAEMKETNQDFNTGVLTFYKTLFAIGIRATMARNKGDYKSAIKLLREAVSTEDSIFYSEPPIWELRFRESLGAILILNRNYTEAEKVFREELKSRPNNPRALFGLYKTLEAEGKKNEAVIVEKEFKKQWKYADTQLSIEDL